MLTIIAKCLLTGQLLFPIPEGWKAIEVYSGGQREWKDTMTLVYCPPECEEQRRKPFVVLRKDIEVGETAEAPQGCGLTVENKDAKKQ